MLLLAQDASILPTGGGWAQAGMGGLVVAALLVLAYVIKLWVDERKEFVVASRDNTKALVEVTQSSTKCIDNNTQMVTTVREELIRNTQAVNDLRERLMRLRCLAEDMR